MPTPMMPQSALRSLGLGLGSLLLASTTLAQEAETTIKSPEPNAQRALADKTRSKIDASQAILKSSEVLSTKNDGSYAPAARQLALPSEIDFDNAVKNLGELREIKIGPSMSLRQAFELTERNHPNLALAQTKIDLAQAKIKQAWTMFLPNASASLQWLHMGSVPTMKLDGLIPGGGSLPGMSIPMAAKDSVNLSLSVGVSLINVANWYNMRIANKSLELTELGVEDAVQQLMLACAQIYFAALLSGEIVKIQRVQLQSALDQLTLAQGRFDAGVDVQLSVVQAQFAVEQARQKLINAIWSYETAREALAIITNTNGYPVPESTQLTLNIPPNKQDFERNALDNNRQIKLQQLTRELQELSLDASIANFLPSLSGAWQYSYSLTNPVGMNAQKSAWNLVFSLSIPIFDFSKFAALDEKEAELRATDFNIQNLQNNTRQALQKARREYYSAVFDVDNAGRQVELSRKALALSEASYSNGVTTFIDLSNARNNATAAAMSEVTAIIQAQLALLALANQSGEDIRSLIAP